MGNSHQGHVHDDDDGHAHGADRGHDHAHALGDVSRAALLQALLLNAAFLVVEAIVGVMSGSLALLSDAGHMLTDVLALTVALGAASFARAAVRGRFTYGLGRLTVLGGLFNAVSALAIAVLIVVAAIGRISAPPAVPGLPVLITGAVGLVVNVVSAWRLHRTGDMGVNMRGAMLHMIADALGSVAAIVSGVVLLTTGYAIVDPIVSVLVAGIVVTSAVPLLRDVVAILLQGAPLHVDLQAMERVARAMPEVKDVIGLHAWALDNGEAVASIVLVTTDDKLDALNAAADRLRAELQQRFHVHHATIEWRHAAYTTPCCAPAE